MKLTSKRKKSFVFLVSLVTTLVLSCQSVFACTPMAVGKDASADGSVMISHTCDGWYDQRVVVVPGGTHTAGETVDIYRDPCNAREGKEAELVGEVPQAEKTYTYYHVGYPFMNENQVMMGEFTWSGRDEVYNPQGLFVIANLEELGLARATTAREAIEIMGALAEEYGYCDGGETLVVGDKNEAWVFEVCGGGMTWQKDSGKPGAHWAAVRIPDDEVFVGANRSRIGVIDFNDKDNYMYSTDITKLAEEMGWWKQGEDFNFNKMFNPEPYGYQFYASRREWRAFSLLAPSQEFPVYDRYTQYPFTIKPDEKVKVQDIMDIYSDHLEGTDYDLTVGPASGAFGNPTRWGVKGDQKPAEAAEQRADWERSICTYRCSYSFVSQSRSWLPDPVGGVLWLGEDTADTTVYVPLYCGITEVPESWSTGRRDVFDPNCAWWAFNFVNNWANLRWNTMYPVIRDKKASFENEFFNNQDKIEKEAADLYEKDPQQAIEYLTKYSNDSMKKVEEGWWDFAWELVGKYYDGMEIADDGSYSNVGYSKEYLESVGYGQTAIRDYNTLNGITTSKEEPAKEDPTKEEPAKEEEKTEQQPAQQPAKQDTTAYIVVIVILAIAVIGLVVYISKKNKK